MPSRKVVSGDTPAEPPGVSVYTVTVNFTLQQGLNHLTLQQPESEPSQQQRLSQAGRSSPMSWHMSWHQCGRESQFSPSTLWVLYPLNQVNRLHLLTCVRLSPAWCEISWQAVPQGTIPRGGHSASRGMFSKENRGRGRLWGSDDMRRPAEALLQPPTPSWTVGKASGQSSRLGPFPRQVAAEEAWCSPCLPVLTAWGDPFLTRKPRWGNMPNTGALLFRFFQPPELLPTPHPNFFLIKDPVSGTQNTPS